MGRRQLTCPSASAAGLPSGSANAQEARQNNVEAIEADDQNDSGVAHRLSGMGKVVGKARKTEDVATKSLKAAFGTS